MLQKFVIVPLILGLGFSYAQKVDCSTVKVGAFLFLSYTEMASFPNPSESAFKSFSNDSFSFNDCGYKISSDGNMTTITAKSFADLVKLTNQSGSNRFYFDLVGISGYKYPSLKQDFFSYGLFLTLDPSTRKVGISTVGQKSLFRDASIGYKMDNGPMVPFHYEGVITPFTYPATTKQLDFYTLRKYYSDGYDRVLFDFSNNTITLWKKFEFPSN